MFDSKFYDQTNKKVIGKYKDETAFIPITEFCGLRSKMYSYIKENQQNNKTCKGVKKISSNRIFIIKTINPYYLIRNRFITK